MKKITLFFTIVLSVLWSGCEETETINPYHTFELYATYDNSSGHEILIDKNTSSTSIQIDSIAQPVFPPSTNRVNFIFNNISIQDERGVYKIEAKEDIETAIKVNGEWDIQGTENKLHAYFSQSLAVVLVLDVSSSLGVGEIQRMKEYATEFVDAMFAKNSEVKIGIVKFSDDPYSYPMSNNQTQIKNIISSLTEGTGETMLYEAMDMGLNLLNNVSSDGKALVTFTDGKNNAQTAGSTNYGDPSFLLQRLQSSNVKSYTIGFNSEEFSGLNDDVLQDLAVNGVYKYAESEAELAQIFTSFANNIAEIYTFVYDTSINTTLVGSLRFRITARLM